MPKHPVYIAMLNEHARSVIGVPHPTGRAAMRMLENEGFAFENYVDIFEGGPTMTARTDQIASVRDAKHVEVTGILEGGEDALIATGRPGDFRCCFGKAGAGGTIDAETARILGVGKRSEEHTTDLPSLIRGSYAGVCLKSQEHPSELKSRISTHSAD